MRLDKYLKVSRLIKAPQCRERRLRRRARERERAAGQGQLSGQGGRRH